MRIRKKYLNSLWLAIFCSYWLFLILLFIFQDKSWAEQVRNSKYTFWMVPTTYKMYTSPPKQNLWIEYHFYKEGKEIGYVEIEKYFHSKYKTNFGKKEFLKDHYLYWIYPRGIYLSLHKAYLTYKASLNNQTIPSVDFKTYLKQYDPKMSQKILQQTTLAKNIILDHPELNDADTVKLSFIIDRFSVSKDYTDENGYDIATQATKILDIKQSLN